MIFTFGTFLGLFNQVPLAFNSFVYYNSIIHLNKHIIFPRDLFALRNAPDDFDT